MKSSTGLALHFMRTLAYARIFFGLTPYFDPQILIGGPFILILILKNFDQNL